MVPIEEHGIFTEFETDDIPWEDGRLLHANWLKMKGDKTIPLKKDFHPNEVASVLPTVMLIDYDGDNGLSCIRLIGTKLSGVLPTDITGEGIETLRGAQSMMPRVRWAVENKKPYFSSNKRFVWANADNREYEALLLPLSMDGENVSQFLIQLNF